MIQTNRIGTQYSDNIIDPLLSFNTAQTWSTTSGTGLASVDTNYSFEGDSCLKIESLTFSLDLVVTNSVQNTVVKTDGNYGLSLYLYKASADTLTGNVKIFKNGLLVGTETFANFDNLNEWVLFVSSNTYSFLKDDVITFTFQIDNFASGTRVLYVDGMKLFKYQTGQKTPPFYTRPLSADFTFLYEQTGWASYIDDTYTSGSPFTVSANTDTVLPNHTARMVKTQKPADINEFYYSGGLDISSVSGTFQVDELITGGTSLATAIIRQVSATEIEFVDVAGTFTTSETITGSTSGATATVDAVRDGYITGREGDNLDIMIYFKAQPSAVDQWVDLWIEIGGGTIELYRDTKSFPKGTGIERGLLYSLSSAYTLDTWDATGGVIYVRSNNDLDIYDINFNFDRSHKAR